MTYTPGQNLRNVYNNENWEVESQDGPNVTLVRRITLPVRAAVAFLAPEEPKAEEFCFTCGSNKRACVCRS